MYEQIIVNNKNVGQFNNSVHIQIWRWNAPFNNDDIVMALCLLRLVISAVECLNK